jgi:ribonuclease D
MELWRPAHNHSLCTIAMTMNQGNLTNPSAPVFIEDMASLTQAAVSWLQRPWLAVDTEFVREDTYFPKLCLVQIGDGAGEACIDTLALAGGGEPQPLLDLMVAPAITKVFHAASQDIEVFVQLAGAAPQPLFDTQIAAALLGLGDQLGYAALVEKLLAVKLDKSLTRTPWARRPLSTAELEYAAADVRYLAQLYPLLRDRLETAGRLGWHAEECARLADPARYRNPPEAAWRRLKGLARLPAQAQHAAAALAQWREQLAQQRDRPRKWILDDDPLYRIATRRPQTLAELAALQALQPKTLERHGEVLLRVLATAASGGEPLMAPEPAPDAAHKARLNLLLERLRAISERLAIPASLLAPRGDVELLLRRGRQAEVPLLRGWRREAAGEEVLALAVGLNGSAAAN